MLTYISLDWTLFSQVFHCVRVIFMLKNNGSNARNVNCLNPRGVFKSRALIFEFLHLLERKNNFPGLNKILLQFRRRLCEIREGEDYQRTYRVGLKRE